MAKPPRGISNSNPGNIRESDNDRTQWVGERPTNDDKAFEEFVSPEYGIRALAKILMNYRTRYGLKTIRQIISRWAPATENDTEAYIQSVSKTTYSPDMVMTDVQFAIVMPALLKAIIMHENGQQPYSDETINNAIALALPRG